VTALGRARGVVAGALTDLGVPVHDQPPDTLQPPCVVVLPGGPWLDAAGHAALEVVAYANPAGGNSSALTKLEELIEAVRGALRAGGIGVHDTDRPQANPDGGVLSATTHVTLMVRC
jgi:hypothetical protein